MYAQLLCIDVCMCMEYSNYVPTQRSLYILISRAVEQMKYIRPAVAAILLFVSLKMIAEYFHIVISSVASLSIILGILAANAGSGLGIYS